MNRLRRIMAFVCALAASLCLLAACSGIDDGCIPFKGISERGPELVERIKASIESIFDNNGGDLSETAGRFNCTFTLIAPDNLKTKEKMGDVPVSIGEFAKCIEIIEIMGAATDAGQFFKCITATLLLSTRDIIVQLIEKQGVSPANADKLADAFGIDKFVCTPVALKLVPDARFLNREGVKPGPEILIPVMIQLLETGDSIVPTPAGFLLLFPGAHQSGETACADLPEPEKRCTDTTGCPEPDAGRPPGAEDPGAGGGTGDVIPPGQPPGGATGDYP